MDLHFRLYQQTERGSVEQSLRRVALTGSALDKVPSSHSPRTDRARLSADLRPIKRRQVALRSIRMATWSDKAGLTAIRDGLFSYL